MKSPRILAFGFSLLFVASVNAQQDPTIRIADQQAEASNTPPVSYLTGSAINTTDHPLAHVFVHFNLYDQQNALVGNTVTDGENIAPGETWPFKAGVAIPYDHFRVTQVDAY